MTVDEYLRWSLAQDDGRYELVAGEVVAMAPETNRHVDAKYSAWLALRSAIQQAGVDCSAIGDGVGVAIGDETVREPDFSVQCGSREPDERLLAGPVIVGEVLSPTSTRSDTGAKLAEYFRLPSVRHYLIVDPFARLVIRHSRAGADEPIATEIHRSGLIVLNPPDIEVAMQDLFGSGSLADNEGAA
jgi:Uma2 family endonuclease